MLPMMVTALTGLLADPRRFRRLSHAASLLRLEVYLNYRMIGTNALSTHSLTHTPPLNPALHSTNTFFIIEHVLSKRITESNTGVFRHPLLHFRDQAPRSTAYNIEFFASIWPAFDTPLASHVISPNARLAGPMPLHRTQPSRILSNLAHSAVRFQNHNTQ